MGAQSGEGSFLFARIRGALLLGQDKVAVADGMSQGIRLLLNSEVLRLGPSEVKERVVLPPARSAWRMAARRLEKERNRGTGETIS